MRGGIMPCGDAVVVLATPFFEGTEFDELVAHHVGIGRQPLLHRLDSVAHHVVPVFLVQVHLLKAAAVFFGDVGSDLDVLFGRTVNVSLLILHADADIEDVGIVPLLLQKVYHDGAVHPARNKCCYIHCVSLSDSISVNTWLSMPMVTVLDSPSGVCSLPMLKTRYFSTWRASEV